jgi:hypothetical protein
LIDRQGVFFGGKGATARFDGVTVTSWDPEHAGPDEEPDDGRPFVLYQEGSRQVGVQAYGGASDLLIIDNTINQSTKRPWCSKPLAPRSAAGRSMELPEASTSKQPRACRDCASPMSTKAW